MVRLVSWVWKIEICYSIFIWVHNYLSAPGCGPPGWMGFCLAKFRNFIMTFCIQYNIYSYCVVIYHLCCHSWIFKSIYYCLHLNCFYPYPCLFDSPYQRYSMQERSPVCSHVIVILYIQSSNSAAGLPQQLLLWVVCWPLSSSDVMWMSMSTDRIDSGIQCTQYGVISDYCHWRSILNN